MEKLLKQLEGLSLADKTTVAQRLSEMIAMSPAAANAGLPSRVAAQIGLGRAMMHVFGHQKLLSTVMHALSDPALIKINSSLHGMFGDRPESLLDQYALVFQSALSFADRRDLLFPKMIATFMADWPVYFEQDYPGYAGGGFAASLLKLRPNSDRSPSIKP